MRTIRGAATACTVAALMLTVAAPARAQGAQAQGEGAHTRAVLAGGVSFAGGGLETSAGPGLAGHIGLRHQRGRSVFSARAGMNGGGSASVNIPGGLRDRFDEIAVLAGYAIQRGEGAQAVLSAGLALVSGERVETRPGEGTRNVSFDTRVGFPLQLAVSAPDGSSGFGLVAHANLNPEEAFGAVALTYLIGAGR